VDGERGERVDRVAGARADLEVRPGAGDPVDPFTALSVHGIQP
jgi:hypothetical protein